MNLHFTPSRRLIPQHRLLSLRNGSLPSDFSTSASGAGGRSRCQLAASLLVLLPNAIMIPFEWRLGHPPSPPRRASFCFHRVIRRAPNVGHWLRSGALWGFSAGPMSSNRRVSLRSLFSRGVGWTPLTRQASPLTAIRNVRGQQLKTHAPTTPELLNPGEPRFY